MVNYDYRQLRLRGDISHRLLFSYFRLESKFYTPDYIFIADPSNWPGDWEGRTMLALVRLSESTGKESAYLEEMIDRLEIKFNEKGYLGEIYPDGVINEQQLSGHNWLLRALLEHYRIHGTEQVYNIIKRMVQNLYMPAKGMYSKYPLDPEVRGRTGEYAGTVVGKVGNWITSSDIGCAYMSLDALSLAYTMFKDPEVKELLDEMVENFIKIDFVGAAMQTHASLSATRGIIRLYNETKDEKFLKIAKDMFELYEKEGMTENYANQNWFGRPTTWTEPCAIVDSYMCAAQLFAITKDIHYLEMSHKIFYNAFGFAQRPTGGCGCDVCVGFDNDSIRPSGKGLCEAVWCCTMRGAEGLSEYAKFLYMHEDDKVYILNYNDSSVVTDGFELDLKTKYPYDGAVNIKVSNSGEDKKLMLFIPSYLGDSDFVLKLDGEVKNIKACCGFAELLITAGEHTVELTFDIPVVEFPTFMKMATPGYYHYSHGFLMLGSEHRYSLRINDKSELVHMNGANYRFVDPSDPESKKDIKKAPVLGPINNVIDSEADDVAASVRQVLFRKK